jgi:hypothetical protein
VKEDSSAVRALGKLARSPTAVITAITWSFAGHGNFCLSDPFTGNRYESRQCRDQLDKVLAVYPDFFVLAITYLIEST